VIHPLEEIAIFTPLGIRFWDPALETQVRAGLAVSAWPRPALRPRVPAYRTASDVYAFARLPGLLAVENLLPADGGSPPASPPERRPFVVEVDDSERRYLPVAFGVELPLAERGLFLSRPPGSPAEPAPPGFFLFSAATRTVPGWLGVVRGELWDRVHARPAAHALVEVAVEGADAAAHGLADAAGRFAVVLAYPPLPGGLTSSPPPASPAFPSARSWGLALQVFYQPGDQRPLPGTTLPDYASVLAQEPARVWPTRPEDGGVEAPEWLGELTLGRELLVRTTGLSTLLVSPAPSSP
jgi:hypothetical protein